MFGHILKGIVVLPPHASTIERESEKGDKKICSTLSSLFFLFRTLFLTFSVLSFSSLYLSPYYLFSFSISPYSLSLLYSLLFSLSHSLSYSRLSYSLSLTLTPTIFPTLFPLSLHSLHRILSSLALSPIFLSFSYAHSYSVYLLSCLSYSLSLSILLSPTLSLSLLLSLSPSWSLSLLLCLSYSLSSSPHSPLFLSPPSLTLCPLSPSVCLCCGFLWGWYYNPLYRTFPLFMSLKQWRTTQ